jgi:cell division protein FtsB
MESSIFIWKKRMWFRSRILFVFERVADLEIKYHTIRQEKITQDVLGVQGNLRDRKKRK